MAPIELFSPSALGLAVMGAAGVYGYRHYIDGCRIKIVTCDSKSSAAVRQTDAEGVVTLRDVLYTECPSLSHPDIAYMVPTLYLATGLLQTIYATMRIRLRDSSSDVEYTRELLTMTDGATLSLDWYEEEATNAARPIAMVMSGVGGSSHEHHIRALAKALATSPLQIRVVVVNHRGTARTPITASRPYDVGFTEDFRGAVAHVHKENLNCKIIGIGFSMGANILTKYMGEEGNACPLTCAVTVCCPFDIVISGAAMNESNMLNNLVFQPAVMSTLMRALKRAEHMDINPEWGIDKARVRNAKWLSEIEDELLVKVNGYKDRTEYYTKSSSARFVDSITVPYLAINSLDDRITPAQGIPVDKFTTNPNIALALVPRGGHLGFLTGIPPKIWFIKPILEFISAILR
ncbi:hypothetical protein GGI25_001085 [Coemansia spiralis]|uniref:AB hydrolase-1 domain-containing protein n=2 Tax=Coemansia TaxID=4863 RepID=A0A9W8GCT2_9FUNG|nr:Alpha/Beta hydrolase protein [Coemansia spiralis]KAJ1995517.1 hypothetical protein EDC05_000755 [Coemansia umbellata]KAJ2625150.1 hypothetical protein GGI26_000953 [Coemansia sp. RSA 1358]KAJ2679896.1 hypothetical protein GGI25_001085 [Coemansia spiralis]